MKNYLFLILLSFGVVSFSADREKWELHLSYETVKETAIFNKKLYLLTKNGNLICFDSTYNSISTLTKINGLNDLKILSIKSSKDALIIVYENLNIDIIINNKIINIQDIKRKFINGKKELNNINVNNDRAYISTSFGFIILDINKFEIIDTYFLEDLDIKTSVIFQSKIYISTNKSIYSIDTNSINKSEIINWTKEITLSNLEYFSSFIISENISAISSTNYLYNKSSNNGVWDKIGAYSFPITDFTSILNTINCPRTNNIRKIIVSNGSIYVTTGGISTNTWYGTGRIPELYKYTNNKWATINLSGNNRCDLLSIAFDPKDNSHYFCCFFIGSYVVVEVKNDSIINEYNKDNSTIQKHYKVSPTSYDQRVSDLCIDESGTLWVLGSEMEKPLIKYSNNQWSSFYFPEVEKRTTSNMLNTSSQLWIMTNAKSGSNKPIGVFDKSTNTSKVFYLKDQYNNDLGTQLIKDIKEDKNNNIWIATLSGVYLINNPMKVFDNDYITVEKIYRDGESKFLLEDKRVTSIAIDGNNNKWFGTEEDGVYWVSEEGKTEYKHFTTDNSPLPSNNIISIGVDGVNSKVYIGTENGIITYMNNISDGKIDLSDVYAYPNPVRPHHNKVYIKNLIDDTEIKITDVSGDLVYQTNSLGGTIEWDLKRFDGQIVKPGVYLVFCNDKEGEKSCVAKFVVIR